MSSFNWQTAQAQFSGTRYAQLPQGDVLGLAEWERFITDMPFRFQTRPILQTP
jgi:hypothetical protein